MTDDIANRIAKLPVWARARIEWLERDLADARREIESMLPDNVKSSRVQLAHYFDTDRGQPLPDWVIFHVAPTGDDNEGYIEAWMNLENQSVEVRGSRPIDVRPQASNSIAVTLGVRMRDG